MLFFYIKKLKNFLLYFLKYIWDFYTYSAYYLDLIAALFRFFRFNIA